MNGDMATTGRPSPAALFVLYGSGRAAYLCSMIRIIILDNGHGSDTPGKRSPVWSDGAQLLEWEYTRRVVKGIASGLEAAGIPSHILVPEDNDIPLKTRVQRANELAAKHGASQVLLVSVHLNAAARTDTASGWEVHTYLGRSVSDDYARVFWDSARDTLAGRFPMRGDHSDGDPDWDSDFAILRGTMCPAVLTENLFMNNERDCRFLMSEEGLQAITDIHLNAIKKIFSC